MSTQSDGMPRDFGFGDDEALLRDVARKLFSEELPVERLRKLVAPDPEKTYERGERPDWDRALWGRCVELGWTGLAVPAAQGGADLPLVGVAALVEEAGRAAFPSPLLATLASSYVLRAAASEGAQAALETLAAGRCLSLAMTDAEGHWERAGSDVRFEALEGGGLRLAGEACFVQDAFKVDAFLVLATDGEESRLCLVDVGAPGLHIQQDHIHDLTRDQATLRFEGVEVGAAAVVSEDGLGALRQAWPAILVLASADLVGVAEWQLQTTTGYARTRKQFDRPIGFFQAVKHPLSDALVMIDRARSLFYHAACCFDHAADSTAEAARMAKSAASDAGRFMSDRSVQLHGGIGFTWECDVHIYFKRSMHGQALYGDGGHHRQRLAETIIGPIGAA
jgi:alkylation response protein AidB-like acyl-CoA dehydrogenase